MAKKVGIEIVVDSKGAITSLNKLGTAGKQAGDSLTTSTKQANTSFLSLRNIGIAAVIAGAIKLAKDVGRLNDQYSLLRSQIKLVVDDSKNLESVQAELLQVANETRQAFASTVTLYTRLDRATEQLFLTDKQVIQATETLNKAIIVSGASSVEAESAIIQLSQGLGAGALRGEELNSVLEQTPRIARLIADGLGVTIGELRKLGSEGKITAEAVISAIQSQSDVINEEFKQIEQTSGQTWTVLTNNVSEYITELESVNKVQSVFNSLLNAVSEDFQGINAAKTLEIAKNTSLFNRTLEQQNLIIKDIIKESSKYFNDYSKNGREQASILLTSLTLQRDEILPLIEKRIQKEKKLADEIKKTAEEEKKRQDILFEQRKELALLEAIDEKRVKNIIANFARIEETNKNSLELIRSQKEEAKEYNEKILREQIELEQTLELERQALGASSLEMTLARIDQEAEKRLLKAGEIAQTEAELIKFVEDIAINAEKKKTKAKQQAALEEARLIAQTAQLGLNALKEIFGDNKLFALSDIAIKTAQGVIGAFANSNPLPIQIAQASFIGGIGLAQASKVNSQKFADGGFVSGAGTGRSDSIPASLSNGEFVVNSSATSDNRELLEAINNGGRGATQNITINAGAGTDIDALAQAVTNAVSRANQLRLEPQI